MTPGLKDKLLCLAAGLMLCVIAWHTQAAAFADSRGGCDRPAIVGGEEASPGAWPWQVAVYTSRGRGATPTFHCGGTLINEEWVLTAAHCVINVNTGGSVSADRFEIGLGMHDISVEDGDRVPVAQVVSHPQFGEPFPIQNDIALIRLTEPISPTDRIRPVRRLGDPNHDAIQTGKRATVTGWGLTSSSENTLPDRLRQAEVPMVSCEALRLPIPNVICTTASEGTNTCHGDSGGPLLVDVDGEWLQAGITSVGLAQACDSPNAVSLFTNVASYGAWITEVMGDERPMMERAISAPTTIEEGAEFEYAIDVRNTGREVAEGVVVRNEIPAGVEFVSSSGGSAPSDGIMEWSPGQLGAGDAFTATYVVRDVPLDSSSSRGPGILPVLDPALAMPRSLFDSGARPDVVGGQDAAAGAWPWQVALFADGRYQCGGSLISDRWVLTAAHCLDNQQTGGPLAPGSIEARLGSVRLSDPNMQRIGAVRAFQSGAWEVGLQWDIGLIKLADTPTLSDAVRPVSLLGLDDSELLTGEGAGIVTGWGMTTMNDRSPPETLQQVELEILEEEDCLNYAPNGRLICAGPEEGGRSACFGDSGGPFVAASPVGYTQIGVVSAGTGYACGAPGNYSLFTRVSLYHDWIAHKLATEKDDKVIVNDNLEVASDSEYLAVSLSPARTFVEPFFDGPLPTPIPTGGPPTPRAIYLPTVRNDG